MTLFDRSIKQSQGQRAGSNLNERDDAQLELPTDYRFLSGIVLDVISNPQEYLNLPVDADKNITVGEFLGKRKAVSSKSLANKGVSNWQVVETMPINSLIANIVDNNESQDGALPVVCYPFFPPHLSLPIKPGEYVWIVGSNVKGVGMVYYWMCRKVGPIQVDDVNFTQLERLCKTEDIIDIFKKSSGTRDVAQDELDKCLSLENAINSKGKNVGNLNTSFGELFVNSYAFRKEFTGEPVPRVTKDCSDLLLQGSNNAGIHLTTEKFTAKEDLRLDEANLSTTPPSDIGLNKPMSPAIDLFVRRKKEHLDNLTNKSEEKTPTVNVVKNNAITTDFEFSEIDKISEVRYKDFHSSIGETTDTLSDASDVGARLYMSNRCDVDNLFGTHTFVEDSFGPSIFSYATHNRIIGQSDVKLHSLDGNSYVELDNAGTATIIGSNKARLQAYAGGTIELAVRDNNESPTEAYVLVSELEKFTSELFIILNGIRAGAVSAAGSTAQTVGAISPGVISTIGPGSTIESKLNSLVSDYGIAGTSKFRSKNIFGE